MNQTQGHIGIVVRTIVIAAGLLTGAPAAWAGDKADAPRESATASTLKDAGLRYEQARLLPDGEKVAGFEEVSTSAATVARGGSDDEKASARALAATVMLERGDPLNASEEFRRA